MAAAIEARVRSAGKRAIVDLSGEVDREADAALLDAYRHARNSGATGIVLNFTDVGYINSTGIALIVNLLSEARKDGLSVTAFGLSDHYRHIFEITRLSDYMALYADEATATAGEYSQLRTKEA